MESCRDHEERNACTLMVRASRSKGLRKLGGRTWRRTGGGGVANNSIERSARIAGDGQAVERAQSVNVLSCYCHRGRELGFGGEGEGDAGKGGGEEDERAMGAGFEG